MLDPLFACFNGTEKIFQWHGDTFDIPHGAEHLATSEACPNQAFLFGEHTYGLQFHLEVDEAIIQRWLKTPVHIRELEQLADERFQPDNILTETQQHIANTTELGDRLFGEYIRLFSSKVRRTTMPSR